jgi:hypothetical protein
MSQYFIRRMTRKTLDSITDEVQAMHNLHPIEMRDGLVVHSPDQIPIIRAIDLGEPHLVVMFHKTVFQENPA